MSPVIRPHIALAVGVLCMLPLALAATWGVAQLDDRPANIQRRCAAATRSDSLAEPHNQRFFSRWSASGLGNP